MGGIGGGGVGAAYHFGLDPEFGKLHFIICTGFGGVVCYKDDLLAWPAQCST